MSRLHYPKFYRFIIVSTRIFLGLVFFSSGMGKLIPFPGLIGPVWLEAELSQYGLGMFARFIAYSQITVGLLLLSQRFATLGAVMLFPLVLNIFMVTVSMNWQGTPYVLGFFILLNIILLVADYHKLKFILTDRPEPLNDQALKRKHPGLDAFWGGAMLFILCAPMVHILSKPLAYVMIGIGLITFMACQFRQRKLRKLNYEQGL